MQIENSHSPIVEDSLIQSNLLVPHTGTSGSPVQLFCITINKHTKDTNFNCSCTLLELRLMSIISLKLLYENKT